MSEDSILSAAYFTLLNSPAVAPESAKPIPAGFEYIVGMKAQVVVRLLLSLFLIAAAASAQNQPGQAGARKPPASPTPSTPEKKVPLVFVKIAADVARNVQPQSLIGYLAIYIDSKAWDSGLKDSDLGPFLKVKEAKPDRSAVCFFSDTKDAATCVYFDGDTAFGVTAVKAGASGKIEAADVANAYKPVSKDMLKKGEQELRFEPGDANTDDGYPLPAFQVATGSKFPS
jgi:hypothetical protein